MDDEAAMELALTEAAAALAHGDVPVGAVVLRDGVPIAQRHNERERLQDPTAHAEVLALRDAADALGTWRLEDCTLVVTLEPCVMCAGAAASLYNVFADPRLNHNPPVSHGVRAAECAALLTEFFAGRRSG